MFGRPSHKNQADRFPETLKCHTGSFSKSSSRQHLVTQRSEFWGLHFFFFLLIKVILILLPIWGFPQETWISGQKGLFKKKKKKEEQIDNLVFIAIANRTKQRSFFRPNFNGGTLLLLMSLIGSVWLCIFLNSNDFLNWLQRDVPGGNPMKLIIPAIFKVKQCVSLIVNPAYFYSKLW